MKDIKGTHIVQFISLRPTIFYILYVPVHFAVVGKEKERGIKLINCA